MIRNRIHPLRFRIALSYAFDIRQQYGLYNSNDPHAKHNTSRAQDGNFPNNRKEIRHRILLSGLALIVSRTGRYSRVEFKKNNCVMAAISS